MGKLTAGQEAYNEEQVARGGDDYYSGRGEAPGQWTGALAAELGLVGEVGSEAFAALLLEGRDPGSGVQLRGVSRVTAYDLTFSAPKSVSVLYAIANDEVSEALCAAHDEAVSAAVGYLERQAVCGRRGKAGAERVEVSGLAAGAYRHRMSREGDPQLHTHVVAANLTRGVDGRWGALHAYPAYQHAKAAGCLYEAHLRWAVRERLPWVEWGPVRNGIAEIEGVPDPVRVEFSQRRQQILEWVAEHGTDQAGLRSENAVLATRPRKAYGIDTATWRQETRARAAEHGLGEAELQALIGREVDPAALAVTDGQAARAAFAARGGEGLEAHLTRELAGPTGLTRMRNTFAPRHAHEQIAAAARQGAPIAELETRTERVLAGPGMLFIGRAEGGERRYTTTDLRDHEETIVTGMECRRGENAGRVDRQVVARVLEAWPVALNDGQRDAVERLTSSGHGFEHVEALAGTGKTTMLGALAECYRAHGYQVVGVAKTGRAVRELKERAGVPQSLTGASLLGSLDRYGQGFGPAPTVLVFDEAAMCDTREASRILAHAEADHVKVIAVGDSKQLPSVEAGGWFGALTRRHGALELTEVMRQRDPHERTALAGVRDAEPDRYVALKRRRGELQVHATGEMAEQAAVAAWHQAQADAGLGQAVMVARDNTRRQRLNQAARTLLKTDGHLTGPAVQIAEREFMLGDRVIARRNDRLRDVDNGMRGTVVAVNLNQAIVTIEADTGGRRELDRSYIEDHLEHAYALTGHGTQGGTLEHTIVVGRPEEFTLNWGYTALSRARENTTIHLVAERPAPAGREELAPGEDLDRTREQTLAALGTSLRRPDVEDLALEQLEAAQNGAELELDAETPVVAQPIAQESAADRLNATRNGAGAEDRAPRQPSAEHRPGREDVHVADPLHAHREALGPARASRLPHPAPTLRTWLAGLTDHELAAVQAEHAHAIARFDGASAYHAARLDAATTAAEVERAREQQHADALRARRDKLSPFKRSERRDLEQTIAARDRTAAYRTRELHQLATDQQALRDAGRHPDQWIDEHGQAAVTWAEAGHERAVRNELELREAEERALADPPAYLHETIGPRPQGRPERCRWDELARALERHRLEHNLNTERDGPLGPHPAAHAGGPIGAQTASDRSAYLRRREQLAAQVRELRAERGLEPAELTHAPELELSETELDLGP